MKIKSTESKLTIFLKNYWPLLAYILISVVFLFPVLRQQGIPFKYDWGWPLFSLTEFWHGIAKSGTLGIASIPGKYAPAILGLPGLLQIPPSIGLKIFLLLIHITAGYGFFLFVNKKTGSKFIAFVAGLVYAFSPYIFIRTIVGFTYSLVAYAVLPLFLLVYFQPKKKFWYYLLCALFLALIFSQFQAGVLVMLFLIINLAFSASRESLKNFLITISSLAILILPWYIVGLFVGSGGQVPAGGETVTLKFIADLPHSLRNILMLSDHHVTSNFFYSFARLPLVMLGFAAIYLVASFSLFDRKNRSFVLSFLCSSALILPFSVGPTGKFAGFYTYVFQHFPHIALFRETYHFQFLLSFALIFLFALGVAQIYRWFSLGRTGSIIIRSIAVLPVLIMIAPYFSFDYAGYFRLQQIPAEYRQANDFFRENKQFCTKAYYPPNLGFIYFKDDLTADAANSDLIAQVFGVPFLTDGSSVLNTASDEMFFRNKLTSQFLEESDSGETAALMKEGGVDCLIVRTDIDTKYAKVSGLWLEPDQNIQKKWQNDDMLSIARFKPGLKLEKQFGDRIFIYKVETTPQGGPFGADIHTDNAQIEKKPEGEELPITNWANEYDQFRQGWSRGRYAFWRKKIFADLEQDFIYTTKKDATLLGQTNVGGDYQLYIRYLDGGTAGEIELRIQNKEYRIKKNPGEDKFVVKDLGEVKVKKGDKVEIKNLSGENAIADLVCLY